MDDCLYKEPQFELVYTLENTSDSRTEFVDAAGTVHSLWAEPNSLLVIRCTPAPRAPPPSSSGTAAAAGRTC